MSQNKSPAQPTKVFSARRILTMNPMQPTATQGEPQNSEKIVR